MVLISRPIAGCSIAQDSKGCQTSNLQELKDRGIVGNANDRELHTRWKLVVSHCGDVRVGTIGKHNEELIF